MGFIIARIITVIILIGALGRLPYSYYTLLRFIVCGVTAYGAYYAKEIEKIGWVFILGFIALLFNPLIPIHLDRGTWAIIDVGVAIIIFISLFLLRKRESIKIDEEGFSR